MLRFLLVCFLVIFTAHSRAGDYSSFASAGDSFAVSASQLIDGNTKEAPILVWLGKVLDVSVYTNKDGVTAIEWFCEQHPFNSEPKLPLSEPFIVQANASGHFVVSLNLPTLSIAEAKEKVVAPLKSPAWVLVRGESVFVRAYKGTNAVFLHSLNAAVSDTMSVKYVP
jgi:hypothetical protein